MKVVLSPAKAIDLSKVLVTKEVSIPHFIDEAEGLVKKLKKFSSKKIGAMMHLSKDLSDLNQNRYQNWEKATALSEEVGQVSAIFNGEVYRGLDALSFDAEELKIAQDKIRILSGLYGVLKPMDVVFPYRLEMGTRWEVTPTKANLYKFWGTKLADFLNQENKDGVLINLASTEYFKAIDKKTINGRIITPSFKEFKNGEYKIVMVFAKRARGMMARYIVKNDINNPEDLKSFNIGGYRFDENLSSENDWVFTR
ncbi:MAG: peroxide stress protein YaaA [Flavobacteriales bacterium]|nr:peroxide stress protein YaaA [Flavobacteriales bacterium]